MDQVALNEVADLRPQRRPELLSVVGDHQDGHHFTTRRMARGSAAGCCCGSSTSLGGRRRSASSPLAISHCSRLRSTGDRPNLASCNRSSCSSSLRSLPLVALRKSSTKMANRASPSTSVSRYSLAIGDCHTRRHHALVSRCHFRPSGFGRVGARRRSPSGGGVKVAAPAFLFRRWRRCAGFGAGPLPAMVKTPRPVHGKILLPVRLRWPRLEVFDPLT